MSGDPRSPWFPLRPSPSPSSPNDFPPDGPFRYTHLNDAALHFSFPILCFYLPAIVAADLFLARQPRSFIPERVTLRFACGLTWGTAMRNAFLFRCGVFLLSRLLSNSLFSKAHRKGSRHFSSIVKAANTRLTCDISARVSEKERQNLDHFLSLCLSLRNFKTRIRN